jgi:hypothetical protein
MEEAQKTKKSGLVKFLINFIMMGGWALIGVAVIALIMVFGGK